MKIKGKIPVTVFPTFWILAALIAIFFGQGDFFRMIIWVVVIFISVLFHEYGHALTALAFGRKPRIELVAMGGLTYHDGEKLPIWKQFLITLNGPLFGFILVLLTWLIGDIPALSKGYAGELIHQIYWVNIVWTVVNLLPILPLDGGQLLRLVMEKIFGFRGIRVALVTSAIISLCGALLFFLTQNFLAGAIFFLFAFENFDNFRKSRLMRATDSQDDTRKGLVEAEMLLRQGDKQKALEAFEQLRSRTKEGIIFTTATQYAAFLKYDLGHPQEAYSLLLPLKEKLDPEALALLHRLAFEQGDFPIVMELSGSVFQLLPAAEVALRSAYAAAHLKETEASIGWLQTAGQSGVENLKEITSEKTFDPIRNEPAFQEFLERL